MKASSSSSLLQPLMILTKQITCSFSNQQWISVLVVLRLKPHSFLSADAPLASPVTAVFIVLLKDKRRKRWHICPPTSVLSVSFQSRVKSTPTVSPSEPLLDSELQWKGEFTQLCSSWVCSYQKHPAEGSRKWNKMGGLEVRSTNTTKHRLYIAYFSLANEKSLTLCCHHIHSIPFKVVVESLFKGKFWIKTGLLSDGKGVDFFIPFQRQCG